MILKEAYRYQNYLSKMLAMTNQHLRSTPNIVTVRSEHLRSKSHPDSTDETTDNLSERTISAPVDHIVQFGIALIAEKQRVAEAIDKAKAAHCPDVDRGLMVNRCRQELLATLKSMSRMKHRERQTTGTDMCFNVEGNQVVYRYPINEITDPDFDRNAVREAVNTMQAEADKVSNDADYSLTSVEVECEPRFNINDAFDELVEQFSAELSAAK